MQSESFLYKADKNILKQFEVKIGDLILRLKVFRTKKSFISYRIKHSCIKNKFHTFSIAENLIRTEAERPIAVTAVKNAMTNKHLFTQDALDFISKVAFLPSIFLINIRKIIWKLKSSRWSD